MITAFPCNHNFSFSVIYFHCVLTLNSLFEFFHIEVKIIQLSVRVVRGLPTFVYSQQIQTLEVGSSRIQQYPANSIIVTRTVGPACLQFILQAKKEGHTYTRH